MGIDAGTYKSAYVIADLETLKPIQSDIVENKILLSNVLLYCKKFKKDGVIAIELIENRGMPIGQTTIRTCYLIGQIMQICDEMGVPYIEVYRHEEKALICENSRAKDSNIRQALIDMFGVVGTKKDKGWFYGFKKDIWQAYAVAYVGRQKIKEESDVNGKREKRIK